MNARMGVIETDVDVDVDVVVVDNDDDDNNNDDELTDTTSVAILAGMPDLSLLEVFPFPFSVVVVAAVAAVAVVVDDDDVERVFVISNAARNSNRNAITVCDSDCNNLRLFSAKINRITSFSSTTITSVAFEEEEEEVIPEHTFIQARKISAKAG